MKANRPVVSLASGASAAALLLLCSCVGPGQTPVAPAPAARPLSPPPPSRPAASTTDWHDMPATAGVWRWSREGRLSVARFGPQQLTLLSLTCNSQAGSVSLAREGQIETAATMAIKTTSLTRTLPARPTAGGLTTATLPARDSLLDAMAFSRGRFAVEVPGLMTLYLPSWPEVGRVIEDCR